MLAYVISALSNWLYTYILVALLLAAGLLFHAADALCAASDVWRILPGPAGGKA